MNSEKSLINLVKKGDKKAYEVLVLQYQDRLVFSVYKFLKDYELAQDIAQEAFVKAFKNLSSFKGDSKFSTWLYRIVYYTSLDAIKKNKKEQNTFEINEITFNQIESVIF